MAVGPAESDGISLAAIIPINFSTTTATMSDDPAYPNAPLLSALSYVSSRPDHYYPSPEIQPKRASVALIIWIKPPPSYTVPDSLPQGTISLSIVRN